MSSPSPAPETTHTCASPQAPPRLLAVDALRGFALLGILVVNVWAFADPFYASGASNPAYDSGLDHTLRFLVTLFAETKFYLLFSFLFGYSFTLQMASAERGGTSFRARMIRRHLGLLVIGLADGALLYPGEILTTYAILGLVLLVCRTMSVRTAVVAGTVLVLLVGLGWVLLGLAALAQGDLTGAAGLAQPGAAEKLAAFGGSASQTVSYHAGQLPHMIPAIALLQAPSALAMFFFGFAAGRRELFARPEAFRRLGRLVLLVAAPIGLAGATAYALTVSLAPGGGLEMLTFGVGQLTAPGLTAGYVVLTLRLFRSTVGGRVEAALAPAGQMALTGYLGQSLALGLIFTGYGLGLVDQLAPLAVLGCVVVLFCAQLALSRWWLRSHRYGPVEWLLRAVTIAGRPQWRRATPSTGGTITTWPV